MNFSLAGRAVARARGLPRMLWLNHQPAGALA